MKIKTILLALSGLLAFSTCYAADAVKVLPPAQKVLGAEGGRYVFGQINEYQRDQFLLDTASGRVWRMVESWPRDAQGNVLQGAQKKDVLQSVQFVDREGGVSDFPTKESRNEQMLKEFDNYMKNQKTK